MILQKIIQMKMELNFKHYSVQSSNLFSSSRSVFAFDNSLNRVYESGDKIPILYLFGMFSAEHYLHSIDHIDFNVKYLCNDFYSKTYTRCYNNGNLIGAKKLITNQLVIDYKNRRGYIGERLFYSIRMSYNKFFRSFGVEYLELFKSDEHYVTVLPGVVLVDGEIGALITYKTDKNVDLYNYMIKGFMKPELQKNLTFHINDTVMNKIPKVYKRMLAEHSKSFVTNNIGLEIMSDLNFRESFVDTNIKFDSTLINANNDRISDIVGELLNDTHLLNSATVTHNIQSIIPNNLIDSINEIRREYLRTLANAY